MVLSSPASKRLLFVVAISGLSLTAALIWILKQQDEKKKQQEKMSRGAKAVLAEANSSSNGAVPPKADSTANKHEHDLKVMIHEESVENHLEERGSDEVTRCAVKNTRSLGSEWHMLGQSRPKTIRVTFAFQPGVRKDRGKCYGKVLFAYE